MVKKLKDPPTLGDTGWVYDTRVTCRACGGQYQPETGDRALKIRKTEFDSVCPYCNGDNRSFHPTRSIHDH